jgi:hypothetical protein
MLKRSAVNSLLLVTISLVSVLTVSQGVSAQSCVAPPPGLVSWWSGNGNANDIVGQNNGTLKGGVTFAAGQVGQSFSFNGVDGFVEIPDSPSLTPLSNSVTLDAWIRPDVVSGPRAIVTKYSPVLNVSWVLMDLDGLVRFGVYQAGSLDLGRVVDTVSPVLTVGEWQHIAGTFDIATQDIKIYVNGLEVPTVLSFAQTQSTITSIKDSDSPVRIGALQTGDFNLNYFWSGLIDEVEIFDRALAASEIQSIFNAGSAGKCEVITVSIDIKPNEFPNSINLGSNGVVPVVILSSSIFDATTVNPTTITLAEASVKLKGNGTPMASFQDVNADGRLDLVVQVSTTALQLSNGDTQATLTGLTFDGKSITGIDSVRIVP